MARTSTLYQVQLEIADIPRSVYESVELRVACHPSEDAERLVVRTLAFGLAYEEDLRFGRGLSHADDPALLVPSPRGGDDVALWIDVGAPSADRLHRASKKADRVHVFTDKSPDALTRAWSKSKIHRSDEIAVTRLPDAVVRGLAAALERKVEWHLTVQEDTLMVVSGSDSHSGALVATDVAAVAELR